MTSRGALNCFFVSDLHGQIDRYEKLFQVILKEHPAAVFLGGDLFPAFGISLSAESESSEFATEFLAARFAQLRDSLGRDYPRVFLILGNDDLRADEAEIISGSGQGLWEYVHNRHAEIAEYQIYGYAFVPPTPFRLKDWERYDVSRYLDPNCIPPEEGLHSVATPESELKNATIKSDLEHLAGNSDLSSAIFLFHSPPYQTNLDRAALDGKMVDHAPLDLYVGSIAIRRFIEARQPLVTLHGHVHESAGITGSWKDKIGRTHAFSAAHDGRELALVRFDPGNLDASSRELL